MDNGVPVEAFVFRQYDHCPPTKPRMPKTSVYVLCMDFWSSGDESGAFDERAMNA
jgi:hypothetical protein